MQVIKDFFSSEKAVFAFLIFLVGSALVIMGRMTVPQYQAFSLWVLGIYTGGKALAGGLAAIGGIIPSAPASPAAPSDPKVADVTNAVVDAVKELIAQGHVVGAKAARRRQPAHEAPVADPAAPTPSSSAVTKAEKVVEQKS